MGRLADYCTWDALSPKDVDYLQKADAVIEAAKVFAWSGVRSEYDARDKAEAALIRAVMALQEVE